MHAAKSNLSRLVEEALAGEVVTIARDGEPLVDLVVHRRLPSRRLGFAKGKVWIQPDYDFDAPDPEIEWNLNSGRL